MPASLSASRDSAVVGLSRHSKVGAVASSIEATLPMDGSSNEVLLDEMPTPDGVIELVAYRSGGTVWVGVRPKGWSHEESPVEYAIGLHTGSEEHYVEATLSMHRAWGVAFGAVAPEVERVAVRNDQRDVFPAVIIPLPAFLDEDYRAAWGLATNCGGRCELIGYDQNDRLIAPQTRRTGERRVLSASESVELLRQHCDDGLRHYTWVLERPSVPEQEGYVQAVRNGLYAMALVLAFVEGAPDERTAMLDAHEITLRYVESVKNEGWEPPFMHG